MAQVLKFPQPDGEVMKELDLELLRRGLEKVLKDAESHLRDAIASGHLRLCNNTYTTPGAIRRLSDEILSEIQHAQVYYDQVFAQLGAVPEMMSLATEKNEPTASGH